MANDNQQTTEPLGEVQVAHGRNGPPYRDLVEMISDWIWETDENGLYTYSSPRIRDLLGYGPEEVVGKSPFDFMPAEEAARVATEFSAIAKARRPFEMLENTNLRKDGGRVVFETSGVPIFDDEGGFRGYRGVDRDISQRKEVQSILRKSEESLKSLTANIPGMTYRADPDWRTEIIANSEKICGYTAEEFQTSTECWLDVVHPDDRKRVAEESGDLQGDATHLVQAYRIVRKDGEVRWMEDHKTARYGEDGTFLGADGIVLDITERRAAERDLQLFRQLVDHSNDAVFIIRPETGRFEDANLRACNSLGYSSEELCRMKVSDIEGVIPDRPAWQKQVEEVRAKGGMLLEGLHRRKDGTTFPVEVNVRWVSLEENYMVAIVRDITERKEAEEALSKSTEEVKEKARELKETTSQLIQTEKLTALGELAAGVAHEMNQPLNGIKIICQDMLRDFGKNCFEMETAKPNLDDVVELVDKMASIIDQMRIFVRRPETAAAETCEINMALEGVLKLLGQQLRDRGFEVRQEFAAGLPKITASIVMLEQVFMNLITNARDSVEAFRTEGMAVVVRSRPASDSQGSKAHQVVVEVEDNGGGMDEATMERIFEPFFTTKKTGTGTGLGLSIAHRIVSDLGGRIEVESEEGEGAVFRVTLPVHEKQEQKRS
ncbi:PAS domain S-box protein [Verrucomicrobiota bacterium]